jgi:hypothetical protein
MTPDMNRKLVKVSAIVDVPSRYLIKVIEDVEARRLACADVGLP